MQRVFYNILLPVDLTKRTPASIEKAVHLANKLECNLHLLYCMTESFVAGNFLYRKYTERRTAEKRAELSLLQRKYAQEMNAGSLLLSSFQKGDALEHTTEYVLEHSIDLVCYDESPVLFKAPYLDVHKLATKAPCPILVGESSPWLTGLDKIVLPVDEQISADHLRVAIYMAQQLNAAIHLVSDAQEGNAKSMRYLTKTYELLKDNTRLELVCSTFEGDENGQSALHYAQSVQAGLIVANRTRPAAIPGESGGLFPLGFSRRDKIPVLLV